MDQYWHLYIAKIHITVIQLTNLNKAMRLNHVTVRGCVNDNRLAGLQSSDIETHIKGNNYTIIQIDTHRR